MQTMPVDGQPVFGFSAGEHDSSSLDRVSKRTVNGTFLLANSHGLEADVGLVDFTCRFVCVGRTDSIEKTPDGTVQISLDDMADSDLVAANPNLNGRAIVIFKRRIIAGRVGRSLTQVKGTLVGLKLCLTYPRRTCSG